MMAAFMLPGARGRRRLAARLVWAIGLLTLTPAAHALPSAQTANSAAARAAVVDPAQAPSIAAVFREVPIDLWRFVSVDTAIVLAAGGGAAAVAHIAVVGADLVRGQIISQLWVQPLQVTVQRERPDQSDNRSFPSGYAAGGVAAAAVLAHHYGWKAAIPAYLGAAYIATARVHDNKHHLSDVVFGGAMGLAGARTVLFNAGRYGVRVTPALASGGIAFNATLVPAGP